MLKALRQTKFKCCAWAVDKKAAIAHFSLSRKARFLTNPSLEFKEILQGHT